MTQRDILAQVHLRASGRREGSKSRSFTDEKIPGSRKGPQFCFNLDVILTVWRRHGSIGFATADDLID